MHIVERVFQIVVFMVAAFMAWGGGFSRWESLPGEATRTVTYTLYRTLPPPPQGSSRTPEPFCPDAPFLGALSSTTRVPASAYKLFAAEMDQRVGARCATVASNDRARKTPGERFRRP